MSLANRARGEVALVIDGAPKRLCLTLGALAELEAAFDATSLPMLAERITQLGADDLIIVLAALLSGGGNPMTRAELAGADLNPKAAACAVAEAFQRAFAEE